MKNINSKIIQLILSVFVFVYGNICNGQSNGWKWVHPTPQGNTLRWCKVWNASTWYALGNAGVFIKTTNGGSSWFMNPYAGYYYSPLDYSENVSAAYFFDQSTGIILGDLGIRKTTDGGVTFNDIPGTSSGWVNLFFLNNNTGYATASNGSIRFSKTTDGGNTWNTNNNISSGQYWDVYTSDDILILVLGNSGNVVRSSDGGVTWNIINTGVSTTLRRLNFANHDLGVVCGSYGVVRLTTDGGLTWTGISNGLPTNTFIDIDFKTAGSNPIIYLTGNVNYVYKSTNLGTTWDTLNINAPNEINIFNDGYSAFLSADFLGGDSLVAVGAYGYINKRFSNSDRVCYTNRLRYGFTPGADINAIWAQYGNGKVWSVGGPGSGGNQYIPNDQIMYSSDGGNSWSIQPTTTNTILKSITMLNANTGYVAGTGGVILKTTNGGNNWNALSSPTSNDLKKVIFTNANTGWIFGSNSTAYKTSDGGVSWSQLNVSGGTLYGGSFIDANTGWIVGDNGLINKTTDGGITWSSQVSGTTSIIYVIKMLNSNTGYLSGGSGVVRKTTDGGNNWIVLNTPNSSNNFFALDFSDPSNGLVAGYQGVTCRTSNGGQSWVLQNVHTDGQINCLYMIAPDTIYAGGQFTNIFKFSGGLTGITEWQNIIPKEYELFQNYPNPFNPTTIIEFAIPKPGNVTLKIYDITGREVQTIFNNLLLNRGTIKHTFDGNSLASGLYFYSLVVDGKLIDTKKMVLIK